MVEVMKVEEYKVKDVAEKLSVSKTSINTYLREHADFRRAYVRKQGQANLISAEGVEVLTKYYAVKPSAKPASEHKKTRRQSVDVLETKVELLERSNREAQDHIIRLESLLSQQQQIAMDAQSRLMPPKVSEGGLSAEEADKLRQKVRELTEKVNAQNGDVTASNDEPNNQPESSKLGFWSRLFGRHD